MKRFVLANIFLLLCLNISLAVEYQGYWVNISQENSYSNQDGSEFKNYKQIELNIYSANSCSASVEIYENDYPVMGKRLRCSLKDNYIIVSDGGSGAIEFQGEVSLRKGKALVVTEYNAIHADDEGSNESKKSEIVFSKN